MQPFSQNQTGTLLRRHLAHFVSAIDSKGFVGVLTDHPQRMIAANPRLEIDIAEKLP